MRIVVGVLLILAVAAGISGISAYSYHLGLAQGVAQSGRAPAPAPGAPYPMYPYGYGWGGPYGYGWHFGFFGFLWPLVWIVLLVFLFRGLWRGGRGHWGGGRCGGGGPRWLEEWHRREHESKGQTGTA